MKTIYKILLEAVKIGSAMTVVVVITNAIIDIARHTFGHAVVSIVCVILAVIALLSLAITNVVGSDKKKEHKEEKED